MPFLLVTLKFENSYLFVKKHLKDWAKKVPIFNGIEFNIGEYLLKKRSSFA
jgi:hypothetical protein